MELLTAIEVLGALAQATRLETFRLLVQEEPVGVSAGDLARSASVPQNTMSAHLSVLARAKLVTGHRHSRTIIYRADLETIQKLMLFMLRDCCGGRAEVCGPLMELLSPCLPPNKQPRRKMRKK